MIQSINELKMLAMDSISKANSGHPGMALGSAPAMYALYNNIINVNPSEDKWINRDRFVLASGHASALLYGILHLSGFDISIEELKKFRQLNSITPGHPEIELTKGVDTTSGPLGQGIPMAVGMALAEQILASKYNKKDLNLIDHYTYALCGDGDMQEGVTQEAISLAGHLKLNKLIVLYDNNDVTLDGPLNNSFSEDVPKRFTACNWNVIKVRDGNDVERLLRALKKAKNSTKPTLIMYKSIIGMGSVNAGKSLTHGAPLDADDLIQLRESLGVSNEPFEISEEVYLDFKENLGKRGQEAYEKWLTIVEQYKEKYASDYEAFERAINSEIDFTSIDNYPIDLDNNIATRNASGKFLNLLSKDNDFIIGGSADVASSTKTYLEHSSAITSTNFIGQNINFGIREFAMASISNGMLLHGGVKPFIGTFLVFADYLKPALRLASLMSLPLICLFSHDSIAVGEDGPTHQPIEQLAMLRSIPNFSVIRPSNELTTKHAYKVAFQSKKPTAIILTRQNVETLYEVSEEDFAKGAYFVYEHLTAKYSLVATGSEVNLAMKCAQELEKDEILVNVISMPSFDLFEVQDAKYKRRIFKDYDKTISIEMASSFGWGKYAKHNISIDMFGKSGKASDVIKDYKFDVKSVTKKIKSIIKH